MTQSPRAAPGGADGVKARSEPVPAICGVSMRSVSLVLLVLHTVAVVFAIRLSRQGGKDSIMYLNSTTVLCSEGLKLVLSGALLLREKGFKDASALLGEHLLDARQILRVSVPCFLYTVQNNVLFLALSNLSGAEYQVTYQLKILSTALFSVVLLGRTLGLTKWFSLMLLTAGVVLVQWRAELRETTFQGHRIVGLAAVLMASLTSGLAGISMEALMKRSGVSMWLTNVVVASVSLCFAFLAAMWQDGTAIKAGGFFQGYSKLVWLVVFLQAIGGLVIASVMKYADNIIKCFGNALSIILSCLISAWFSDFAVNFNFVSGTSLVLLSIYCYSAPQGDLFAFVAPWYGCRDKQA